MSGGFQHDVAGGQGNLIIPQLQSPNFNLATQTGWAVLRNGDAYFFNVTATGAVTSNTVVVSGSGDGVFIYDGGAAFNNLVVSVASAAGVDPYGNAYSGPGISVSAPGAGGGKNEIQIRPDKNAVLIYAA
jgi:hypothetical protein